MSDEADVLAFDMPFAKVVDTPHGECLLIGGRVYQVVGPDGYCADIFSKALRRLGRGGVTLSGLDAGEAGCANTEAAHVGA